MVDKYEVSSEGEKSYHEDFTDLKEQVLSSQKTFGEPVGGLESEKTNNVGEDPVLQEFSEGEEIDDPKKLNELLKKQDNIVIKPYIGVLTDVDWAKITKTAKSTQVRVGMFLKKPLTNNGKTSLGGWGLRQIDGSGKGFGSGSIQLDQQIGKNTKISIGDMATPTTFAHNPFPLSPESQMVTQTQNLTPVGAPGVKINQKIGHTTLSGGSFVRNDKTEHHISANYTNGSTKIDASVWHGEDLAGALRFENSKVLSDLVVTKSAIGSDVFVNLGQGYKVFVDGVYGTKENRLTSLDMGVENKMQIEHFDGIIRAVVNPITKKVEFRLLVHYK